MNKSIENKNKDNIYYRRKRRKQQNTRKKDAKNKARPSKTNKTNPIIKKDKGNLKLKDPNASSESRARSTFTLRHVHGAGEDNKAESRVSVRLIIEKCN